MAQRGYLGIHAEVPTAQYLRSASVVNGAPRSKARRGGLIAGLALAGGVHPSDLFELDLWEQSLLARRPDSRPGSCGGVHPSDLFELDLWEQSLLARRPDSRPALAGVLSPIVGASLLAKAAVHSALMQADLPPSRASSAPTGIAVDTGLINDQKPVWERACSRWRPDSRPKFVGMVGHTF